MLNNTNHIDKRMQPAGPPQADVSFNDIKESIVLVR